MIRIRLLLCDASDLGKEFILRQALNDLIPCGSKEKQPSRYGATFMIRIGITSWQARRYLDQEGNSPEGVSWNSAHASRGCGQEDLRSSGGDGLVYCFLAR